MMHNCAPVLKILWTIGQDSLTDDDPSDIGDPLTNDPLPSLITIVLIITIIHLLNTAADVTVIVTLLTTTVAIANTTQPALHQPR